MISFYKGSLCAWRECVFCINEWLCCIFMSWGQSNVSFNFSVFLLILTTCLSFTERDCINSATDYSSLSSVLWSIYWFIYFDGVSVPNNLFCLKAVLSGINRHPIFPLFNIRLDYLSLPFTFIFSISLGFRCIIF